MTKTGFNQASKDNIYPSWNGHEEVRDCSTVFECGRAFSIILCHQYPIIVIKIASKNLSWHWSDKNVCV